MSIIEIGQKTIVSWKISGSLLRNYLTHYASKAESLIMVNEIYLKQNINTRAPSEVPIHQ